MSHLTDPGNMMIIYYDEDRSDMPIYVVVMYGVFVENRVPFLFFADYAHMMEHGIESDRKKVIKVLGMLLAIIDNHKQSFLCSLLKLTILNW